MEFTEIALLDYLLPDPGCESAEFLVELFVLYSIFLHSTRRGDPVGGHGTRLINTILSVSHLKLFHLLK